MVAPLKFYNIIIIWKSRRVWAYIGSLARSPLRINCVKVNNRDTIFSNFCRTLKLNQISNFFCTRWRACSKTWLSMSFKKSLMIFSLIWFTVGVFAIDLRPFLSLPAPAGGSIKEYRYTFQDTFLRKHSTRSRYS